MAILESLATAAGLAAPFFSKSEGGGDVDLINPDLKRLFEQFIPQFIPGQTSGLDFSALGQQTPFEQTGLNILQNFLQGSGTGNLFDQATGQIGSTLRGEFMDPQSNPLIQALTATMNRNLEDQIDATRARRGARGTYFTKEGIEEERRLTEGSLGNLANVIGSILENERARQFQAVPIAAQLDKFRNLDVPLSQVGASQSFGNLQRTLDASELEARYQDFTRRQGELGNVAGLAAGTGPTTGTAPVIQQPSTIGNILNLINKANQQGLFQQIGNIFGGGAQTPSSAISFQP